MPGDLPDTAALPELSVGAQTVLGLLWGEAEAAMVVIDGDQLIRHANPTAETMLRESGFGVGDRLDRMVDEIRSLDGGRLFDHDEWPAVRALRGERVGRESLTVRQGGGVPRGMVLSARPVELADGTVGALVVWHDVTDSWHYAERGRTELARLGQLLEGASDYAIIMLDAAGYVRTWSAAAERLHGYSQEQAIGLPYAGFFDDGDQAVGVPQQILDDAAAHGKAQVEGKRIRGDGSVFWAHAAISAVRDEDGRLRGFVKVTHDVSEQRANERAAVELNELLEERVAERTRQLGQQAADLAAVNSELEAFSYSVSHDLRAPLRAMSGFARIIEQDHGAELPAEVLHYLGKVISNAQHMGSLIDALLSFSRLQRQSMRPGAIDMTELVRECWTALTPARGDRRIRFTLARLPVAVGDRQLIQQVWMNLLDNAIKYTGKKAAAQVEVLAEVTPGESPDGDGGDRVGGGGTVTYVVRDNGAGFDMRYVAKIGQVFQRLHHTEEFEGTGIGLALTQRIVQRHGGRLTAVGEPGAGATFGFTLEVARS